MILFSEDLIESLERAEDDIEQGRVWNIDSLNELET